MPDERDIARGGHAALRRLFGRVFGGQPDNCVTAVAVADREWEAEDHLDLIEELTVLDPWDNANDKRPCQPDLSDATAATPEATTTPDHQLVSEREDLLANTATPARPAAPAVSGFDTDTPRNIDASEPGLVEATNLTPVQADSGPTFDFEGFYAADDPLTVADELEESLDFVDGAQQRPWELVDEDEDALLRRARAKAAIVTGLLELTSMRERASALSFLTELFEELPHPATYRAIKDVADEGLDLHTLEAMVALRRVWTQRPEWWVGRFRGRITGLYRGETALSWRLARRICLARPEYDAERMIDEEWLDEWLILPRGAPGWHSFPAYVDEKVARIEADALHHGLAMETRRSGTPEIGDDYDWYKRVLDRHGAIRQGFHILTPYDDRPAALRVGPPDTDRQGQ